MLRANTSFTCCAAKRMRSNKFCDGEAEQSEDEAVSSDESDIEDEIGALSVDEVTTSFARFSM